MNQIESSQADWHLWLTNILPRFSAPTLDKLKIWQGQILSRFLESLIDWLIDWYTDWRIAFRPTYLPACSPTDLT